MTRTITASVDLAEPDEGSEYEQHAMHTLAAGAGRRSHPMNEAVPEAQLRWMEQIHAVAALEAATREAAREAKRSATRATPRRSQAARRPRRPRRRDTSPPDPAQLARAVELRRSDPLLTVREIASQVGLGVTAVRRAMKGAGRAGRRGRRPQPGTTTRAIQAATLRDVFGMTFTEIGDVMNVSRQGAFHLAKRARTQQGTP